ncbi:MAG: hypothetical protein ACKOVB_12205 [Terrabacter sp.]
MFIIAGIALIAIALGTSGHGLWWLIALVWALGWTHHGRHACHVGRGRHQRRDSTCTQAPQPTVEPDPTHDRHEAFPVR